jgi:hypothetical protein
MTSSAKITFALDTTDATAKLGFEAWIDDHKFYDTDHVAGLEHISVDISDADAEHDLRFVLKNKTTEHTKIDEQGNIVADPRLKITGIAFDEIQLGHMVTEQATYEHDFNGTGQLVKDKFYGEIGCNGTVSLKFSSPIYLWLLEHM